MSATLINPHLTPVPHLRYQTSFHLASQLVEHLFDHVFNIIWAKGVIRKLPQYTVEALVT